MGLVLNPMKVLKMGWNQKGIFVTVMRYGEGQTHKNRIKGPE
jgi:hypothetical protein